MGMTGKTITHVEARNKLAAELRRLGFEKEASDFVEFDHTYIKLGSPVWGCDATVEFDEKVNIQTRSVRYRVQLSWPSTYRTLSQAAVALANYQRALTLAQELEALTQDLPNVEYEVVEQNVGKSLGCHGCDGVFATADEVEAHERKTGHGEDDDS